MGRQQMIGCLLASLLWLVSGLSMAEENSSAKYKWDLPDWVPRPIVPADNPMTREKVELGRHLFYDKRLSANGLMACATCHLQSHAFTDGRAMSPGVTGQLGSRSAMALVNVAYLPVLTWMNPLLDTLELQALIPLFGEHPVEMGLTGREQDIFKMFSQDARYAELFKKAFPNEANQGAESLYSLSTLTKALASFERTLLSFNSPYDRYKYGNQPEAISESAKRGEALFFGEKMECYHCHGGLNLTDNVKHERLPFPELGFHNTGLYNIDGKGSYPVKSPGIIEITTDKADKGKFRTPGLRNVEVTAPYMHDGSIKTLEQVIRGHYANAGRAGAKGKANPLRSEFLVGFEVDEQEVQDLIAFLNSLTDRAFLTNKDFSDPW